MALQYVASAGGYTDTWGATTVDCSSSLNVQAGDVLVCCVGYDRGAGTSSPTVADSDGSTNSFTMLTEYNNLVLRMRIGYVLSATADSSATFRATISANADDYFSLIVFQFRPDTGDSVTLDDGPSSGTGNSNAAQSGDFDTSGTDEVAVGFAMTHSNISQSSIQIADGAVDGSFALTSGGMGWMAGGYRIFASTQSGIHWQSTLASSGYWIADALALKSESTSVTIRCVGIPSAEAVGTPTLPLLLFAYPGASPNPSNVILSDPRVIRSGGNISGVGGIPSGEAVGQPTITAVGGDQNIVDVGGIASGAAVGAPALSASVEAGGIASGEALGSPDIAATISAAGIATAEAVGAPSLAASIVAAGIASVEAVGSPSVAAALALAGIPSAEAVGQPTVTADPGATIVGAGGIASGEAVGSPLLWIMKAAQKGQTGVQASTIMYFPRSQSGSLGPLVKTDSFGREDSRTKP